VVIVQGFQGHFANPWPRTDRICGGWNFGTCERKIENCTGSADAFVLP
jgi:hypothetical protein